MAQIKNTLTRFHKIAERIAQKRQQVQEAELQRHELPAPMRPG